MALFSRKKTDNDTATSKGLSRAAKSADKPATDKVAAIKSKRPIILGPHITEKSVLLNERSVYVFDVGVKATKPEIKEAIKRLYKVIPTDVRVVNHPGKKKRRGNKIGRTASSRKAYITLAKGQSIELV